MKKVFIIIFINLVIFLGIDLLALGILKVWKPKTKEPTSIVDSKPTLMEKKATKYFCDSMHTFENLQQEMAKKILKRVKSDKQIWWFYGGSTTKSQDCEIKKNYPEFIGELKPSIEVHNFAYSGAKSSDQLEVLKYNLKEGNKVDIVFWGSWINELLFLMDESVEFNNPEVLQKYPEFKKGKTTVVVDSYKLARISKTLYENSNLFKLLYHILMGEPQQSMFSAKQLKGTQRFLEATLLNYQLNLKQIKALKDRYKFDIIFIQPPYRESLKGEYELPIGNQRQRIAPEYVEKYLEQLNQLRKDIDWKLDFINFKDELKEYCNG